MVSTAMVSTATVSTATASARMAPRSTVFDPEVCLSQGFFTAGDRS